MSIILNFIYCLENREIIAINKAFSPAIFYFERIIDYFFGNVAFKINASNPAGINPVVNNNFNLIPKSGM